MPAFAYGDGHQEFSLPKHHQMYQLEAQAQPVLTDPKAAVLEQLLQPIDGSLPLGKRLQAGDQIVIIVSDLTRAWIRNDVVLPPLLDHLNELGIPDTKISVLVAIGTHRSHTQDELEALVGSAVYQRVQVQDHTCHDADNLVTVGTTSRGTEVQLHRLAVEADGVILVGGLVYHLMAGFGGGRKSVLPGIAGYATVQANHRMLLHPQAIATMGSGRTTGNALHEDMMEAAAFLQPTYLINVIRASSGGMAAVVGGNWDTAWDQGCSIIRKNYGVPLATKGDLVVASAGGFPTDINLYQASKTLDNAFYAVADQGVIVILAECREGGGAPEFFDWFQYDSLESMAEALGKGFTVPGYVAYHIRRIAQQYPTILVSSLDPTTAARAGLITAPSAQQAVEQASVLKGTIDTLVLMPQGAVTLPVMT